MPMITAPPLTFDSGARSGLGSDRVGRLSHWPRVRWKTSLTWHLFRFSSTCQWDAMVLPSIATLAAAVEATSVSSVVRRRQCLVVGTALPFVAGMPKPFRWLLASRRRTQPEARQVVGGFRISAVICGETHRMCPGILGTAAGTRTLRRPSIEQLLGLSSRRPQISASVKMMLLDHQ